MTRKTFQFLLIGWCMSSAFSYGKDSDILISTVFYDAKYASSALEVSAIATTCLLRYAPLRHSEFLSYEESERHRPLWTYNGFRYIDPAVVRKESGGMILKFSASTIVHTQPRLIYGGSEIVVRISDKKFIVAWHKPRYFDSKGIDQEVKPRSESGLSSSMANVIKMLGNCIGNQGHPDY